MRYLIDTHADFTHSLGSRTGQISTLPLSMGDKAENRSDGCFLSV